MDALTKILAIILAAGVAFGDRAILEADSFKSEAKSIRGVPTTTTTKTCFLYKFAIPEEKWFHQEEGVNIYWLSVGAMYSEMFPPSLAWGWKTRDHFFKR